ncbi:MAG: leucine-rich repeat protein, partial [Prevotella sp.]|nr:leucine-rich repeat protein [Prevotella sp.]
GTGAFQDCTSLTSITIPNNVTSIGWYAFYHCNGMEDVCCLAERVPTTNTYAFEYSHIQYATLYAPASAINDYKTTEPWNQFGTIKAIDGGETKKCATPTISYHNGKLTFGCETEGVEYRSSITDTDINDYTTQEINLSVTYTIKVYAMKSGCQNSDVATGTLCWIDVDPRKEGITDCVAQVKAMPVLIKSHGGQLTVEGAADDTTVSVYNAAGMEQGSGVSKNGQATISTTLEAGSVAIVKIGQRAVKVMMK